ncbi:ribonuclease III family protein [Blattabacterium cuenoti]|uniref:ribonuclease III family protein n=1 Tax=Blattabacterium cuenoti TaxID=1653831 RepID=UPI00163CF63D|nr:ribonuclease III domain-containing protein [Blattabacterium cuenoti]
MIVQKKENLLFSIDSLKKILGFYPKNLTLLKKVFVYDFINNTTINSDNDYLDFHRLEFLGDAVLNSIISHFLCEQLPEKKEGDLTQVRSKIVCRKNLNKISKKLLFENILLNHKFYYISDNILGNTLEALIGFIYLELGYVGCKRFVYDKILHYYVDLSKIQKEIFSYKVWILEWSQKNKFFIKFETYKEDKNQISIKNKHYYLSKLTLINYGIKTIGKGLSKKKSEENAAKAAYIIMKKEDNQTL